MGNPGFAQLLEMHRRCAKHPKPNRAERERKMKALILCLAMLTSAEKAPEETSEKTPKFEDYFKVGGVLDPMFMAGNPERLAHLRSRTQRGAPRLPRRSKSKLLWDSTPTFTFTFFIEPNDPNIPLAPSIRDIMGISRWGTITEFRNQKGETVRVPEDAIKPGFLSFRPISWKNREKTVPSRNFINTGLDAKYIGKPQQISHVKGYYHVFTATLFKHIDVPLEPSEKWIRITPHIEIRILKAVQSEIADGKLKFEYWTEYRYDRKVAEQKEVIFQIQRIDHNNETLYNKLYEPGQIEARMHNTTTKSTTTTRVISYYPIKLLRFVIATKHKVPFEIETLPPFELEPVGSERYPNRPKPPPIRRD